MKDSNTPPADTKSEGFLSRWSSRKLAANETSELSTVESESQPSIDEGQLPTDADMPPVESLAESSDYTGFLSPKVSEELRRLALRKLFKGAVFNTCDGLDDYDEDFTTFSKLGDLITSDMRFQAEEAAKKLEPESVSEAPDTHLAQEDAPPSRAVESVDDDPEADGATTNDESEESEIET